jgi:hypothetical protein
VFGVVRLATNHDLGDFPRKMNEDGKGKEEETLADDSKGKRKFYE